MQNIALKPQVALVWRGDFEMRRDAQLEQSRFQPLAKHLEQSGMQAHAVVYHDDCAEKVEAQLCRMNAVFVWVNPSGFTIIF